MAKKKKGKGHKKRTFHSQNDPPIGRLSSKIRSFEEIVGDLRFAVRSIIRVRANSDPQTSKANPFLAYPLGSGFFVSPNTFMTCYHVINNPEQKDPIAIHQDGDKYLLVSNITGDSGHLYEVEPILDKSLFLYEECDLAIITFVSDDSTPYVALDYSGVKVGQELGVVGYPLPELGKDNDGNVSFSTLKFRAAKDIVSSLYNGTINKHYSVKLIEVSFLFVPGNSGGPVFDASTGRICGYVHGYQPTLIDPDNHVSAIYSVAIEISHARTHLEKHGVSL